MKRKEMGIRILSSMLALALTAATVFTTVSAQGNDLASNLNVNSLTVEFVDAPQGIDVDAPRFGWKLDSNQIGAQQKAYQIVVKDAAGNLAWDSGVVESDDSVSVQYAGENALAPETDYIYTITTWDNYGNKATAESTFSTGVEDWGGAKWVSPGETDYAVSMLRTEKSIQDKAVKSAKLYMTSLGIYKAYINGELVKGEIETAFDPGWVNYNDYINYQTYDVTDYISGSTLALSAELGRGWYKSSISSNGYRDIAIGGEGRLDLALIGKLVIQYEDGETQTIVTDETWKYNNNGPIYNHDFYSNGSFNPDADPFVDGVRWGGEKYDANKEVDGWKLPGFVAPQFGSDWKDARIVSYEGELVSSNGAAMSYYNEKNDQYPQPDSYLYTNINQSVEEGGTSEHVLGEVVVDKTFDLNTEEVTIQPGQKMILNLGQNIAGVLETTMEAEKDTTVVFSHVEMLNDGNKNPNMASGGSTGPKGTIYTANLRGEKTSVYTFGDDSEVTYRPSFTYFGFQYVQITATKPVTIKKVVGKPITSAMTQTGHIETDNAGINKLFNNVLWSQMDNFLSIPTDCPQRNERCGWTGDVQLFAGTGTFNFDSVAFLQNYVKICDNQAANFDNKYTAVMPAQQGYGRNVSSGWSDVGIVLPWTLYQQTGDISIIANSYDQMDKYMDAIGDYGAGYNTRWYGDWVSLQACSIQYLNLAYRAYDAQLMAKMAEALGYADKVEKYNAMFQDTKEYFMNKYVDEQGNILSATADNMLGQSDTYHDEYVDNSQTAIAWALKLGFYRDEEHKQYILSKLLESIRNEDGSFRPGYSENTLAVGFLGLNVILPSLSGAGATDTAYSLLQQRDFPSWLYSVDQGATTIWERWNSYSKENSFLSPGMNSFNHFSFGACLEWMYQEMAGIARDEQNPGFKHFNLSPTLDPTQGINYASASYDSYYGEIESGWTSANGEMTSYHATVPVNTTATLYLPVDASTVENFQNIPGIIFTGMTTHRDMETASFRVTSGSYDFKVVDGALVATVADGYVAAAEANKTILEDVIAYAEAQKADASYESVIPMVKETFEAALENAKLVAADMIASQEAVDNAWITLMGEIHKLGFVQGDKASLEKLVSAAGTIEANLNNYVEKGKAEFVSALADARKVLADDNALQGEVDPAASALLDAMMELRLKADKSLLEQTMATAEAIDIAAYTAETVAAFNAANDNANAVYANENATQDEVDSANAALAEAIAALQPVEAAAPAPADTAVAGDKTVTTGTGSAKTGDTAPFAAAAALVVLAGAGVLLSKKKH